MSPSHVVQLRHGVGKTACMWVKINCDVSKDLYDAYTAPIEAAISSGSWEDLYGAYIRIREPDEVDLELKCENM